jgi:hypothetical protein
LVDDYCEVDKHDKSGKTYILTWNSDASNRGRFEKRRGLRCLPSHETGWSNDESCRKK